MNEIEIAQIYAEMRRIRDHLIDGDSDAEFARLLQNKRVAVVGPARTLIGKKLGRFIDSHDIVVRFNDAFKLFPVPSGLAVDIGTKTDILYCNQVILRNDILQRGITPTRLTKTCQEAGTKYFVCTNNSLSFDKNGSPSRTCDRQDRRLASDFKKLLHQQRIQAGFRIAYRASETLMRWMNGQCGRTGFVAVLDLLYYGVERVSVMGMTFYHAGGHLLSPDSVELHPLKNRDGSWARDHTGLGHDSFVELDLMKLIVQCFENRVEVDDVLAALLQTNCRQIREGASQPSE